MFRFSHRSHGGRVYPMVLGFLGFEFNKNDNAGDSPTAKKVAKMRFEPAPDGWEGLKLMFAKQEPNGVSAELLSCIQLGLCSSVAGFIIGGIDNTKFTVAEFKERNQAAIYRNTFEAQRSVQDHVAKEFFKGGWKMGLKCGSFLFCFSLCTTTLSVYRGDTSILDFAMGGAVTGALFTMNRGLPGALSGGTVGLVLGTITGTALVATFYATGINMNELRAWQYSQYQKRINLENKVYQKEAEKSTDFQDVIAQSLLKPEEREHGRLLDKLDKVVKNPTAEIVVEIPMSPPESMFRKRN